MGSEESEGARKKLVYFCLDWESRRQGKTLVSLSQTVCFRNTKDGWRIQDILSIHFYSRLEALQHLSKLSCLFRIVLIYSKQAYYTRSCTSLLKASYSVLLNSKLFHDLFEVDFLNSKMSWSTRRCLILFKVVVRLYSNLSYPISILSGLLYLKLSISLKLSSYLNLTKIF